MKTLRDIFRARDKKTVMYLGLLLAVGVLLIILSGPFSGKKNNGANGGSNPITSQGPAEGEQIAVSGGDATAETTSRGNRDYETALERRLEEIFSLVQDAGRVRVMVSLARGRETVYAADVNASESVTQETDAQGGSRQTSNRTNQDKTIIITDKSGVDRPLVLRETEPAVSGVIVIAEGGDNIFVKDALTKAAGTILGIEVNKIEILKMEMKGE